MIEEMILKILEAHDGFCLDNEEERRQLAKILAEAINERMVRCATEAWTAGVAEGRRHE